MSIYDNVVAGYNLNGARMARVDRDQIVEETLRAGHPLGRGEGRSLPPRHLPLRAASSRGCALPAPWP